MTTLRRVATLALLVALAVTGILGIAALLGTSDDDERGVQILVSALIISVYGGVLLIAIPADDGAAPNRLERLAFVSGSVAAGVGLTVIWATEPDDSWGWISPFAGTIAAGAVHLILLDRAAERRPTPNGLLLVSKLCVVLLTATLASLWLDLGYDGMVQVVGILAILDVVACFAVLTLGERDREPGKPTRSLSTDTMARLRTTADDLGLSPDELLNAALDDYRTSPAAAPPAPSGR